MHTKNSELLQSLIAKLKKMPIPVLYTEYMALDRKRRAAILPLFEPAIFKELVHHEMSIAEYSEFWRNSTTPEYDTFPRNLLDILDPKELMYVGKKCLVNAVGWGSWNDQIKKEEKLCSDLAKYFLFCGTEVIANFITFLVESTKGVTAPSSEREYDIFKYEKTTQFPFEAIHIFRTVHPRQLFQALNQVSIPVLERLLWLADAMCDEQDSLENVILREFHGEEHIYLAPDDIAVICTYVGLLENVRLNIVLKKFSSSMQIQMIQALGIERVRQMKEKNMFSRSIALPREMNLYKDKNPNEKILKDLSTGKTTVNRLKPKKVLELLGQLA